jgi:hypothetical protein
VKLVTLSRNSIRLTLASVVLAGIGAVSMAYISSERRTFSAPTTITMGTVLAKGGGDEHRTPSGLFCWVSYEFTPDDDVRRTNWRFWAPACGTTGGRAIPIQHLVANPDVNRPAGSDPWFPSWLFFFAAGVALVVAFIMREPDPGGE